ncbi:hypothetical protein RN001_007741 [Aquatica leii]|uniref:Transcription termination factor 3, mitochondrial n=1 Tax=Aquatica leii TaxID=1421715 RepID=A0AAN7P3A9_9COLE|nr:hypothetical protein RN001_007741 [Aquatica leii]
MMADDLDELMVLVKICVKECMMYCSEWLVASGEWMTNNPSAVVSRWRAQLQVQCPRTDLMTYLSRNKLFSFIRRLSTVQNELTRETLQRSTQLTTNRLEDVGLSKDERKSVLEDCTEDISHVATYLKPTFNFAAYVNKSETLQQLVMLNVNLSLLEKNKEAVPYVLGLNFEKDVKNHVVWLSELGIDNIGWFLTKNPFIFRESLENLLVRINYMKSKNFSDSMITAIISRNPTWLMFSTQQIDERLGFFQIEFCLTGRQVRALAVQQPKLITYSKHRVKINIFAFKEEMGLNSDEVKSVLLKKPNLFMKNQIGLLKTFEYVHKDMGIPIERIVDMPEVLFCRLFRLKQRHLFLKSLGRAMYDAKKPNYVSLRTLVSGSDVNFCDNVAKSSIQTFNAFLKTL